MLSRILSLLFVIFKQDLAPCNLETSTTDGIGERLAAGVLVGTEVGLQSSTKLPPNVKPAKYMAQSNGDNIKGVWAIDPGIFIPLSLLPPLERGQTEDSRPNLSLKSYYGSIDADIYVVAVNEDDVQSVQTLRGAQGQLLSRRTKAKKRRVIIHASSQYGKITARIVSCSISCLLNAAR